MLERTVARVHAVTGVGIKGLHMRPFVAFDQHIQLMAVAGVIFRASAIKPRGPLARKSAVFSSRQTSDCGPDLPVAVPSTAIGRALDGRAGGFSVYRQLTSTGVASACGGLGRRSCLSASALTATITLEADIDIAPTSGRRMNPSGSNGPAAIGIASEL
jgi:hypothetical protein